MDITFTDKKLAKLAADYRACCQKMGMNRARLFLIRLNAMRDATNLEELRHVPGRFHMLKGNRKGQWACDVDHPYRLIFEPHEFPIPINAQGEFNWTEIQGVEIIEFVDYH